MKQRIIVVTLVSLIIFISVSCVLSEMSWSSKDAKPEPVRQLIGLPSVAIGNLNPAARNPGLELLCTSLYDVPGGYCYYYTGGVTYVNFTLISYVKVSRIK